MKKADSDYRAFLDILKEELIPAGGCTEPIAIAYTAAVARKTLGCRPEHMDVYASGNLIKNAKGVYIPNGGELRGVDAAAILGALGGNADRMLEVLLDLPDGVLDETQALMQQNYCKVHVIQGSEALHLIVNVQADGQTAEVELKNAHTHIVRIEKNGESVFRAEEDGTQDGFTDHSCLTVEKIVDFANTCDLADIEPTLQKQIDCNMQIAEEGLNNRWGVNVGKLYYENGKLLQAYAAAASDARMSGCNLPVVIVSGSGNQGATASLPVIVYAEKHGCSREQMLRALALSDLIAINSGSGNQGITVSVPVIEYAKALACPKERLYRALVLSNLIAIHEKTGIGRLSAYCGAVCAATGAGCAMTYLDGGTLEQIDQTITNSIATSSGMVCDGAKPSCAAKIATSLESAIMAHDLAMANRAFQSGEGIVMDNVEQTIDAVGCVASQGMHITDQVILNLMTQQKGARA